MKQSKSDQGHLLSSVQNALRILRSFSIDEPEKRVSDLADSLGIGTSTVSRVMSTLASEGFVIKDPATQKYRLSLSILALSGIFTSNDELNREAAPIVNRLAYDLGETAHLAILDGIETVYIHKSACHRPVKLPTHLGKRNPAYCTGSGKLLLAYSASDLLNKVIEKGLHPYASNTITNPDALRSALEQIKQQGYAICKDEFSEGITAIAAPVRDYTGRVVAAISVTGPNQRITSQKLPAYVQKVVEAGKEASYRLGYDA